MRMEWDGIAQNRTVPHNTVMHNIAQNIEQILYEYEK